MEEVRIHTSADSRRKTDPGCTGLDNPEESLKCTFSTVRHIKVGTGTTARRQETRHLWYVEQRDEDEYGVRKVNPQFVPVGDEELIDRETLLADYTPEVELYNTRVEPAIVSLRQSVSKGDKHRQKKEPLSAEMEYTKALDVDETNVRATFGLGLVYLARDDHEKAGLVLDELVELDAAFAAKHKHLFNEFGIRLRKGGLHEEAVKFYSRAIEFSKQSGVEDENLCYNLARAYYELGDWARVFEFASRTLGIDAYHEQALALCKLAVALADNVSLQEKYGKPPVPPEVARKAADFLGVEDDGADLMVEIDPDGFDNDSAVNLDL